MPNVQISVFVLSVYIEFLPRFHIFAWTQTCFNSNHIVNYSLPRHQHYKTVQLQSCHYKNPRLFRETIHFYCIFSLKWNLTDTYSLCALKAWSSFPVVWGMCKRFTRKDQIGFNEIIHIHTHFILIFNLAHLFYPIYCKNGHSKWLLYLMGTCPQQNVLPVSEIEKMEHFHFYRYVKNFPFVH